jgi:2-keto-4-pentenoate hydratase/2-oxohepta-3-ene-1,7-dioic acid hydratase in catechol pathway
VRIARFAVGEDVGYGVVEGAVSQSAGDGPVEALELAVIKSHPFAPVEFTGQRLPLSRARLLAPVLPSKVIAFARTYAEHAAELGNAVAEQPLMFLKPSTSVIGPQDAIRLTPLSSDVQYEAELAVVIGSLCKNVPADKAHEVILGYTCANDVTARDLQRSDGQWSRAKGFDTFCPLGPWIETNVDANDLVVEARLNGNIVQSDRTSSMVFPIGELVAFASQAMTLLPGDVILTGTPAGVGPMADGDTLEVRIGSIGSLSNPVVDPTAAQNR